MGICSSASELRYHEIKINMDKLQLFNNMKKYVNNNFSDVDEMFISIRPIICTANNKFSFIINYVFFSKNMFICSIDDYKRKIYICDMSRPIDIVDIKIIGEMRLFEKMLYDTNLIPMIEIGLHSIEEITKIGDDLTNILIERSNKLLI